LVGAFDALNVQPISGDAFEVGDLPLNAVSPSDQHVHKVISAFATPQNPIATWNFVM
jgi:hypothetical protein